MNWSLIFIAVLSIPCIFMGSRLTFIVVFFQALFCIARSSATLQNQMALYKMSSFARSMHARSLATPFPCINCFLSIRSVRSPKLNVSAFSCASRRYCSKDSATCRCRAQKAYHLSFSLCSECSTLQTLVRSYRSLFLQRLQLTSVVDVDFCPSSNARKNCDLQCFNALSCCQSS